jgi:hypothetical protein
MSNAPLCIYVLWHPAAKEAAALAKEVYRWFHASSDDLLRSGMGVPVYFRSQPASDTSGTPPPTQTEEADLNIVVVLADANMVADPAWAAYLDAIARKNERAHVIPVALHASAYRLPETLRRLNFLRIDERDDPPADEATRHARRVTRLLRQLTEITGRQLAALLVASSGPGPDHGRPPPPLTIFLSHAKRDGIDVAEALRSSIQDHGRLRAFFDDSDLPVGHAFADELIDAAGAGSAAMIAIISDAYAARPWCRREVALAHAPRRDPLNSCCWAIQPLLVVDALKEAPTRNIPELGNATLVRWLPERALETVDLLMLEVVLTSYHRLRARRVPQAPGRHVIAWTPDLSTLLALQRAAGDRLGEVAYPGYRLPQIELDALRHAFPGLQLRTFEDVESPPELPARPIGPWVVGLSTGYNDDLGRLGMGREHLEELTLRVARCVIEAGARIAFGGMLDTSGLTETLLTLVRTLTSDDHDTPSASARILSYQRWPALTTREQIAKDVGISEYVLMESPLPSEQRLANDPRIDSPERARERAHALSAMRREMTAGGCLTSAGRAAPPLHARIVMGGMRTGFNGFMPGVLEEALYALEARLPLFVIGGFGGGAAVLARAMLVAAPCPELRLDYHRQHAGRFQMLARGLALHGEEPHIDALFARLRSAVDRIRDDLCAGLDNGLDESENRRLMQTDHVSETVGLLRRGLARRLRAPAS